MNSRRSTRIINLDENFIPFDDGIKFNKFNFPSNIERHIKLSEHDEFYVNKHNVLITNRINNSSDIMDILLTVDILRHYEVKHISLFIPYLPYGRQDRITNNCEPFSLKVFSDLINLQNFHKVFTFDIHSDVTSALIKNLHVYKNYKFVENILKDKDNYHIVCPDAGAYKKIYDVCKYIDYTNEIVICNKVRNIKTGDINKITVNVNDLEGKDCYIIDDICSRGGTFIGIAQELQKKNCGNIYLIVSHYENSADIYTLKRYGIKKVYTTNSIILNENIYIFIQVEKLDYKIIEKIY